MHEIVVHRLGRQYIRYCSKLTTYDTSSGLLHRYCRRNKPTTIRSYVTSTKVDLPSLDKKWHEIWKAQEKEGGSSAMTEQSSATDVGLKDRTLEGQQSSRDSALTSHSAMGKKMYILPMFPYPSGNLHLGHFRNYTIPDVLARFRRMQGYNVLLPMGWDAFGLPAENAAIERGIDPSVWTMENIAKMRSQLQAMNGSWDWSRELATCDPKYYKHTQHIFLLLHEHGLAYQAESLVNYDPIDKTVLANEQVDASGCSWRSGAKVEKKLLKQWFLRISAYRDALLDDLDLLAQKGTWPERVLSMQRNWLGKSKGARLKFQVMAYDGAKYNAIEVFTTRPDTLFGVQYVALAATHPLILEKSKKDSQLQSFLKNMPELPQDSKDGFLLPDVRAINPLAYDPMTPDATKASLPIYVAPYVLGDYGDGAVMGVPGHDVRDNAFWKQNRGDDPIRVVVERASPSKNPENQEIFVDQGVLNSHSGNFEGRESVEASQEIVEMLKLNKLGDFAETWRLRDWLISRQRYWGTPIPIIHCDSCGPVPVPVEDLPVELPKVEGHWGRGIAGNPLEDVHEWVNTKCPNCDSPAKRETDTMDTFVDSSWYFMRFVDPHNNKIPFSADAANGLLPVDLYVGGVEHAILHLLYARFISKFLVTAGLWPVGESNDVRGEPFKQLLTQGMVHGKTYTDPESGRFLKPEEVSFDVPSKPVIIATGKTPNVSFEKMSKSKYNGVDPSTCINAYGADATRAHMLFQAPASEILEWDEAKIVGVTRWMAKIHDYTSRNSLPKRPSLVETPKSYFSSRLSTAKSLSEKQLAILEKEIDLWLSIQRTILSVTESFNSVSSLNTVVSDLMSLSNTLIDSERACNAMLRYHSLSALLRMMAPITPAFAEECWSIIQEDLSSILKEPFPSPDNTVEMLQQQRKSQVCAVQINGKLKFAASIPLAPDGLEGQDLAQWATDRILKTEEGKQRLCISEQTDVKKAKKVIVVRGGKTVNFVM